MSTSKKQGSIMYKTMEWGTCLLLSGFLAGCSLPPLVDSTSDEEEELSMESFYIETDQAVYLVKESNSLLEITYTYINEGKQTFYLGSCLGYPSDVLEKLVDEKWVLAYTPTCPDVLRPPIKVVRGERYEATIQLTQSIWDPERPNASWQVNNIEGTYRIRELVYLEWDIEKFDEGTLSSEIIVSNAFDIRRAP